MKVLIARNINPVGGPDARIAWGMRTIRHRRKVGRLFFLGPVAVLVFKGR